VARGYGVPARDVASQDELAEALREAIGAEDGPRLVQARVASGMWME
jgi:thiamine pyrophosphate-dependent acetolactate synthase large subunit-like protein